MGGTLWGKQTAADLAKAAEYFRRALTVDPGYAKAYLGLADCYSVLGSFGFARPSEVYPRAKAAVSAALTINPNLPEAHASLGFCAAFYEWDRDAAEAEFRRAIDMLPGYAFSHQSYGASLIAWQRFEEGLAALRTAGQLEPLSPMIVTQLAAGLYVTGRHAEAEETCLMALELEPHFWPVRYFRALICEQERRYEEAVHDLRKAAALSAGNAQTIASLAHIYASAGETGETIRLLRKLDRRRTTATYVPPFLIDLLRTCLFDSAAAFEALEHAYHERSPHLGLWLTTEPRLEFLRVDRRYSQLLDRTGLIG